MKRNFFSAALLLALGSASAVMAQSSITTYDVCDVNHDSNVSVADATTVVNRVLANNPGSEVVTAKDLNAVLQLIDSRLAALETANGIDHPTTPGANTSSTYFEFALKSMQVGQTFTQTVHTESTGAVSYFSTNTTVATVNATTGEVTAKANGETTIVATIVASGEYPAASAAYTVTVETANMHNGYEYVDLGVVVDGKTILWAKTNIGANKPADYGDYYAWGETETKISYKESTYAYCQYQEATEDEYGIITGGGYEYVNIGEDISGTEYDVAHVKWQGLWRMPTVEEQDALLYQCKWTWCQMKNSNNETVNGYKVEKNGDPSVFIFLPASGGRNASFLGNAGSYGFYWSSSLDASGPSNAYGLYFNSSGQCRDYDYRYCGFTVRPVLCSAE